MGAMGMRARIKGGTLPARLGAAAALLVLLAGCASTPSPSALLPAPSPTPTAFAEAGVGDEIVLLTCSTVVPVVAVAGVLGVPVAGVVELPGSTGTLPPFSDDVGTVMATEAMRHAGLHGCRYGQAGLGENGSTVTVSMLPDAAAEFGLARAVAEDGVGAFASSDLGDAAFSGCRDGEWQGCRAEVLVGTTWLSISVGASGLDPAGFAAYAGTVVDAVTPLKLARPLMPPRPECGSLLSPHDLSDTGGLAAATGGDALSPHVGSLAVAAEIRGGLVQCAWSSGSGDAGNQGVVLTILPGSASSWASMTPAVVFATDTLPAVDLSQAPNAEWPSSGVQSRGACTVAGCEVTLVADGVWLTVVTSSTSGATDLSVASALAAAAYARYAATV
jgi:hypothetical protein